jgi:protein involved in polysaccharide export with SLBB domain
MTQRRIHAARKALLCTLSFLLIGGASRAGDMLGETSFSGAPNLSMPAGLSGASIGASDGGARLPTIRDVNSDEQKGLAEPGKAEGKNAVQGKNHPLPFNYFQKFVLDNNGHVLPVFGADFFNQPAGEWSSASAPVSPDYMVGPGDELRIRGWGSLDLDVRAVVDRNGAVHLPRIGAVNMAGVRVAQTEDVIRNAVGKYHRDFQVSVTLGQLRGITVYVVGQARQPGAFSLSGASTLISGLLASGGPNQNGSLRNIQVVRGQKIVTRLDMYAFLSKGDKSADIRLQDGDTIVIPPVKGYVAMSGKVPTPAIYEIIDDNETIGSMLALAGGLPVVADPKRVELERIDAGKTPARSVEAFALDDVGLLKKLKNGDLLSIITLVPEFSNAVTLRGNVAEPLRSPWRPGMKVHDLIPSKEFLITRASIKRQNDSTRLPSGKEDVTQTIGNLVDEVNFEYAVLERVEKQNASAQLHPFNLGKALDEPSGPDNLTLQPGDIVTVFSANDVKVPISRRKLYVRVEGEVLRPGIYQMKSGETIQQLVDRAGGLTNDAYVFGTALYREEVRQSQTENLEKLVNQIEKRMQAKQHQSNADKAASTDAAGSAQARAAAEERARQAAIDRLKRLQPSGRIALTLGADREKGSPFPALKLAPQDRLVVPSRPDFVHIYGAVNTEASLIWQDGKTVQHYLDQSGMTGSMDLDELFVIRADGSVASKSGVPWYSSVSRLEVNPGDVIVLPEKTDQETGWSVFMRNAKDITQIIYQFSLGAAAIKTLRE